MGSENVKTIAARQRHAEHAEHADASSNEADEEERDDGPDAPPSFDELPSARTLGRAKPLTRTHVAAGPLDLSLSVDQIMTNVLHVPTPAVRRRKKAHSRSAPSLPTLGPIMSYQLPMYGERTRSQCPGTVLYPGTHWNPGYCDCVAPWYDCVAPWYRGCCAH